mgnify:CR=1 FL=1
MKQYTKMKDSGIEWIGEIPEEWGIKKIKRHARVMRGASPRPIDDPKFFDENGKYLSLASADLYPCNQSKIKALEDKRWYKIQVNKISN